MRVSIKRVIPSSLLIVFFSERAFGGLPHSESLIVLPALLLDEWSAAKCAAWRNGSMSSTPMDGFDSTSLKRKYDEVERAATKKALKRRLTVRQHADV
jgi:hypothetical protein